MKVTLLSYTQRPEKIVAAAAKLCYSSAADIETLMDDLTPPKVDKFVQKLESLHHESPFEHCYFSFGIEGVSRALLAQITRHRMASFSVRSQRYCAEENFEYVMPPEIYKNDQARIAFRTAMADCRIAYQKIVDAGVNKEDARMVLPNACDTRMVVTMNVRELWHFFNLRCCSRAQWEIRELANEMLTLLKDKCPLLFKHAGAACVKGYCPEGDMSCGKAPSLDKLLEAYHAKQH